MFIAADFRNRRKRIFRRAMERIVGVGQRVRLPEPGRSVGHLQRRHRTERRHRAGQHHGGAQSLPVLALAGSGQLVQRHLVK